MQNSQGSVLLEVLIATTLLFFVIVSSAQALLNLSHNFADLQQKQYALHSLKYTHELMLVCQHDPSADVHRQLQAVSSEIAQRLTQGKLLVIKHLEQNSLTLAVVWKGSKQGFCSIENGKSCVSLSLPYAENCLADLV